MNYKPKHFDEKEFLTTFIKMLRYAVNKNGGCVDVLRCSSALGKSTETVLALLDLFEDIGFIKILEQDETNYKINLEEVNDLSLILQNEKYNEVKTLVQECEIFQKKLVEDDLNSLELV